MSEVTTLTAERRDRAGKGAAREARRQGKVPAVVYGDRREPAIVSLDARELGKQLRRPGFLSHVFELDVDGRRERVLPREVQHDPLSDRPIHVDFMRVSAETQVEVDVELSFVNEAKSPGLKQGGVLNVVRHSVTLLCRPDTIPESLVVDLAGLELGDVVHLQQLALPAGVQFADAEAQSTIASIAAPTSEAVAAPTAEEGEATA